MYKIRNFINNFYRSVTLIAALILVLVVCGIFVVLLKESLPVIREYGVLKFITSTEWDFSKEIYGGARPLIGTIITTALALLFAVPMAIGIAIFLTEICPFKLRNTIGTGIELLAAIPSIIYGMWGLFVFAPFIEHRIEPLISATLGNLPIIGSFFTSQSSGGVSIFTASAILAIMIVPFISSIARDTFNQVPSILKESAYGIGSTKWETVKDVVLPFSKVGVAGGVIIAMGRALGETMAVAYVIGNRHGSLESIFSPFTTITSVLANEFNEASGIQMSSMFMLALILFVSNLMVLSFAKFILRRSA